jgi:hypothetical protein
MMNVLLLVNGYAALLFCLKPCGDGFKQCFEKRLQCWQRLIPSVAIEEENH